MPSLEVQRYQFKMPENLSDFDPKSFVEGARNWIDTLVGDEEEVAVSVSGGVDSTTVAFLMKEVLGNRLHLYFINDGLRRVIGGRDEHRVTAEMFSGFPDFEVIHAADRVLPWFEGEDDGSAKREIFRGLYTTLSNRHLADVSANWIADGTIAPDIVMTDQNRQIQHNVNLPYSMRKLEPLAPLYKPHVRRVARYLGLSEDFAARIPCPGPAQLLRVGGKFSKEKLRVSQDATDIVEQMVEEHCRSMWGKPFKYDEQTGVRTPFQYFATCIDPGMIYDLPLSESLTKSLGRKARCFRTDTNAMWIDAGVERQEKRLYEPILWLENVMDGLDGIDDMAGFYDAVTKAAEPAKIHRVYLRIPGGTLGGYTVGIKAVESDDVRTARPMNIPMDYLVEMGDRIRRDAGASMVAYDISRRPPATIELF